MSVNVQYVGLTATGTRIDKIEKLYHTGVKQAAPATEHGKIE